jgi:addiction module HigA family antidote
MENRGMNNIRNEYAPNRVTHPGLSLEATLESLKMTQREFAGRTGRPVKTINEIVKGKASITPETALQFETVLGIPATFWLRRQADFDEHRARREQREQLKSEPDWIRGFPIKVMERKFGFAPGKTNVEQLHELLSFFGVASIQQYRQIWQVTQVRFRLPRTYSSLNSNALAAWLRKGELVAQSIECAAFDEWEFREVLPGIRGLTKNHPGDVISQIRGMCAEAGVAHALVPELPGIRVSGAARWFGAHKGLIQQNLRYKTNDQFWFTFFHEAAHILLHRSEQLIVDFEGLTRQTDEEADRFAGDFLIGPREFDEFVARGDFSSGRVRSFAEAIGISPAIVVGRLQHDRHIGFSELNSLKRKFQWASN